MRTVRPASPCMQGVGLTWYAGNVSEAIQNLTMGHASMPTFLKHCLSRRVTVETQAVMRGIQPQAALMRAACTMNRSIDRRRPRRLTPEQSASVIQILVARCMGRCISNHSSLPPSPISHFPFPLPLSLPLSLPAFLLVLLYNVYKRSYANLNIHQMTLVTVRHISKWHMLYFLDSGRSFLSRTHVQVTCTPSIEHVSIYIGIVEKRTQYERCLEKAMTEAC